MRDSFSPNEFVTIIYTLRSYSYKLLSGEGFSNDDQETISKMQAVLQGQAGDIENALGVIDQIKQYCEDTRYATAKKK